MNKKLLSLFLLLLVGGCQSYWAADPDFGSSVSGAISAQTVNPNAATQAPSEVRGMDGVAAKTSIDSYQNSFIRRNPATGGPSSGSGYFIGTQPGGGSSGGSNNSVPIQ